MTIHSLAVKEKRNTKTSANNKNLFVLVFISPSSRYALLDTADLPLTIRETTVDYQVQSKLASVAGIQRGRGRKNRGAKRYRKRLEDFLPSQSLSDHASLFRFSSFAPLKLSLARESGFVKMLAIFSIGSPEHQRLTLTLAVDLFLS